jgi:hypothetical protein
MSRADEAAQMARDGLTLAQIGAALGVSRQRAYQLAYEYKRPQPRLNVFMDGVDACIGRVAEKGSVERHLITVYLDANGELYISRACGGAERDPSWWVGTYTPAGLREEGCTLREDLELRREEIRRAAARDGLSYG